MNAAIASIKSQKNIQFVDWCPTGFKVKTSGSDRHMFDSGGNQLPATDSRTWGGSSKGSKVNRTGGKILENV